MSDPKHRGILVCVDGSAESDAAVAWAAREAAMRGLPITVIHAVAPVVVGWPVGQLYADMPAWQQDGAQQVIDQARKIVIANQRGGTPPEMRTEIASWSESTDRRRRISLSAGPRATRRCAMCR